MSKEIINITDITEYLYCPRKVWLRKVKKIKEPANKAMILGYLKHKIFDIFNKNEAVIVSQIKETLDKEKLISLYKTNLLRIIRETISIYRNMIKAFKIDPEELMQDTLSFMEKEIEIRIKALEKTLSLGFIGKQLWRNLKPKYLTEFEIISDELGLKGRVDRIMFAEKILPYEIKTRKEIFEADKIQLAAYSLLLEKEFGKKIGKGVIETKKGQEEIQLTKELKDKVLDIAEKIRNMDSNSETKFLNNFSKCKNCRLKKECFEL